MQNQNDIHKYTSLKDFRYGLRQVIIVILFRENIALTSKEIFDKMMEYKLSFNPVLNNVDLILNKLSKLGLIKHVYRDQFYAVKLTDLGIKEYRRIRKS